MADLSGVIEQLKKEREQAAKMVAGLDAVLAALGGSISGGRTGARRKLSAAGRARIAAAQKARWAKLRSRGKKVLTMPKKRTMSPAARARIAAAQRARWAKVRAKQKKA